MIALLTALACAASAAEPSLVQSRPRSALVDEIIELKPRAGHHFNPQAPQQCGGERALEVIPRRFRCQLAKPGAARVLVSVCDDAETFCRQERFTVDVRGAALGAGKVSPTAKASPRGEAGARGIHRQRAGRGTLARAKKRGQAPLHRLLWHLVPRHCNELEERAYPDPAFKAASADFIKLGLDADAAWSPTIGRRASRWSGYPTLVVADSQLREIGRMDRFFGPAPRWRSSWAR